MGEKILSKKKTPKISILFGDDNNSVALRDIISWSIASVKENKLNQRFDVTTIGNWLLDHHLPFIKEFAHSHEKRSSRLQSKRTYIKTRFNELIELGLIKIKGTELAQTKFSEKQVYEFTNEGYVFVWLIEARYSINERRLYAIKNFFNELAGYAVQSNSSFVDCFIRYVNQCIKEDAFDSIDDDYLEMIIGLFPITQNYFRFFRALFLDGLYTNQKSSRIFLRQIEETEKETQHLILMQLKLDIESNYYDGMGASREWEKWRYDNIDNHSVITLQGYCLECKLQWPFLMDIFHFLKLGSDPKCYGPDGGMIITGKLICSNCNKPNCRFVVPIWYVPTDFIKPVTTIEYLEGVYDIIQTKGSKIEANKHISNEYQKVVD